MDAQSELAAKRYAKALLEAVGEGASKKILQEFEKFVDIYSSSEPLRKLFTNPAFGREQKSNVLDELGGRAGFSPDLQNFLAILLEQNRIHIAGGILEAYREKIME